MTVKNGRARQLGGKAKWLMRRDCLLKVEQDVSASTVREVLQIGGDWHCCFD